MRLREANIKLKASKCHFAYPQVTYLGHIVSRNGIRPDPDKVSAVREFLIPKKVKDVRSFLGLQIITGALLRVLLTSLIR